MSGYLEEPNAVSSYVYTTFNIIAYNNTIPTGRTIGASNPAKRTVTVQNTFTAPTSLAPYTFLHNVTIT